MMVGFGIPVGDRPHCNALVVTMAAPSWRSRLFCAWLLVLALTLFSHFDRWRHFGEHVLVHDVGACATTATPSLRAQPFRKWRIDVGDTKAAIAPHFRSQRYSATFMFGVIRAARAARPSNCSGRTFTTAETVTFDPAEPGPYTVDLSGCAYKAGLTLHGDPAAAGWPLIDVTVVLSAISGTFVTVAASLNFSTGSALLIDGAALGVVTIAASAHGNGIVQLANVSATSLSVSGGFSALGRQSLFSAVITRRSYWLPHRLCELRWKLMELR